MALGICYLLFAGEPKANQRVTMESKHDAPTMETTERVMFFDTDAGGVVHNIAYLRFIETNRSLLAERLGWKLGEMMDLQECPVVVRTEIDYRRPARLWDKLVVHGKLEKFDRARFWCSFTIQREVGNDLLITCRQMLVVVKLPDMRVLRLPPDWESKFGDLKA
jgi:YbgC/YbaW family acyl-CoA thioester hydrolase